MEIVTPLILFEIESGDETVDETVMMREVAVEFVDVIHYGVEILIDAAVV